MQWCVAARFCAAELVITAAQDQKANATLTELVLWGNDVGDAGATALADALQATVLVCGTQRSRNVHLVATDVALQGGVSSWRRRVVVQLVLLFFSCVSNEKRRVAWSVVRELF